LLVQLAEHASFFQNATFPKIGSSGAIDPGVVVIATNHHLSGASDPRRVAITSLTGFKSQLEATFR